MQNFFQRKDRWGHGWGLWVLVAMAFLAPLAVWSARRVDLENDIANWLPDDDPQARVFDWYRSHFTVDDRILLSWDDSALDDPRVERLARRLEGTLDNEGIRRGGSDYVEGVATPRDLVDRLVDLDVERDEAVRRLEGVLVGRGKLRLRFTEAGRHNPQKTLALLQRHLDDEVGIDVETEPALPRYEPEPAESGADPAESQGTEEESFPQRLAEWADHDARLGWPGMGGDPELAERVQAAALTLEDDGIPLVEAAFFHLEAPVALAVLLSEAGEADRSTAFAEIRRLAEEEGVPPEDLHLGGRHYAASQLHEKLGDVGWNADAPLWEFHRRSPFLTSVVLGVLLSFVLLRSLRLSVLVLLTSLYVMLLAVALVPATGGSMNMVLAVMPTLLMVLTISAAIHVCNYWRHAENPDARSSVIDAFRMAAAPCTFAAVTTAIGLVSLTASPLLPVRHFGLYSAVGCLISLVVVLFGLPSLLLYWPGRKTGVEAGGQHVWKGLGHGVARHRLAVSLACLALFLSCAWGLRWFQTETKVIHYFPQDSRVVTDYRFLEDHLAGIVPVETLVRFDEDELDDSNFFQRLEAVRRIQDRIATHRDVSGTMSLATFRPPTDPRPEKSGLQRMLWERKARKTEKELLARLEQPDSGADAYYLRAEEDSLLHAANGREVRVSKGDELWRITARVSILSDLDYGQLVGGGRDGRPGELDLLVQDVLREYPGGAHLVTGMVPLFLRTQQAVLDSLVVSFGLAFGIIAVVMMILLRSPLAGLLTMLPNLLPVGVVFGLVSWNGLAVDIGTMITASVALGIAVDGTLHLLTWFQDGIRNGLSREDAVARGLSYCGPAMWQTAAVVGVGLFGLAAADLLLISRFGWLMAALIGMALLADVVFLPALLAGPLGGLIERSIQKEAEQQAPAPQPVPHTHGPHVSTATAQDVASQDSLATG